jgi:hypothetical protein
MWRRLRTREMLVMRRVEEEEVVEDHRMFEDEGRTKKQRTVEIRDWLKITDSEDERNV